MAVLLVALLLSFACVGHSARIQKEGFLQNVAVDEDCEPQQVHIALADSPEEMHVTWKTAGANCESQVSWWLVRDSGNDRPDSSDTLRSAVGYSFLLSERDMCSQPASSNAFALHLHRAVMSGLAPGARYRYQVAGAQEALPFRARPRGGPRERVTFVAFGDMGEAAAPEAKSPGSSSTLATLQRREMPWLDLVLHVGDISYANGRPSLWDAFMDEIEHLASRVPYMVQVGNHEYGYSGGSGSDPSGAKPYTPGWGNYGPDSGGECGVMLARRFHMPGSERQDNPPFWYGFDYGSVHFTAISTEHDLSPGSPQHVWLQRELGRVDRCTTPWLVLLLHRPMYVVYPHKANREVGDHIRASLEPLLQRYGVDAIVSGHVHSYYRTCPVYDGRCASGSSAAAGADGGPGGAGAGANGAPGGGGVAAQAGASPARGAVHIVVGAAGHELSDLEEGQEPWLAAAQRVFGYTRFSVDGADRMRVEFVSSESGGVLDAFDVPPAAGGAALRAAACAAGTPAAPGGAAAPAS